MDLSKQPEDMYTLAIIGFSSKVHGGAGGTPQGALEQLRNSDSSNSSPEGLIGARSLHALYRQKAHIHTPGTCGWLLGDCDHLGTDNRFLLVSSYWASLFDGSKATCASPGISR